MPAELGGQFIYGCLLFYHGQSLTVGGSRGRIDRLGRGGVKTPTLANRRRAGAAGHARAAVPLLGELVLDQPHRPLLGGGERPRMVDDRELVGRGGVGLAPLEYDLPGADLPPHLRPLVGVPRARADHLVPLAQRAVQPDDPAVARVGRTAAALPDLHVGREPGRGRFGLQLLLLGVRLGLGRRLLRLDLDGLDEGDELPQPVRVEGVAVAVPLLLAGGETVEIQTVHDLGRVDAGLERLDRDLERLLVGVLGLGLDDLGLRTGHGLLRVLLEVPAAEEPVHLLEHHRAEPERLATTGHGLEARNQDRLDLLGVRLAGGLGVSLRLRLDLRRRLLLLRLHYRGLAIRLGHRLGDRTARVGEIRRLARLPGLELLGGHGLVNGPGENLDQTRRAPPARLGEDVPVGVRQPDDQVGRGAAVHVAARAREDLTALDLDAAVLATEAATQGDEHDLLVLLGGAGDEQERVLLPRLDELRRGGVEPHRRTGVAIGRRSVQEAGGVLASDREETAVPGALAPERGEGVGAPVPRGGTEAVGLLATVTELDRHFGPSARVHWNRHMAVGHTTDDSVIYPIR